MHYMFIGRETRGQSTSKLTDASCTLGEEKSKSKYSASPAHTPVFLGDAKKT